MRKSQKYNLGSYITPSHTPRHAPRELRLLGHGCRRIGPKSDMPFCEQAPNIIRHALRELRSLSHGCRRIDAEASTSLCEQVPNGRLTFCICMARSLREKLALDY